MWLHLSFIFFYNFFFITAAIIVSLAIRGTYKIAPLLIAFNIQGILQGTASLVGNLIFLYLLNRFVDAVIPASDSSMISLLEEDTLDETDATKSVKLDVN